ncbi:hypothetical protein AAH978_20310 [Streptomyces sp. ZYX-F-203]
MTLVETGTRSVIAAVFGPVRTGETSYATHLSSHPRPDMPVPWDRGFDSNDFLAAVHATGTRLVDRIRQRRHPPIPHTLADASYLSTIAGVPVRIIETDVRTARADGSAFTGSYRPVTTPLDAQRHPADSLVRLYREAWEHESAYTAARTGANWSPP